MRNKLFLWVVITLLLGGCASQKYSDPRDPFEPLNRKIYAFNRGVDKLVFKPLAEGYRWLMPDPVETGIHNVFENLDDVTTAVNGLLQGKFKQAGSDLLRFVVNSTVGVAGIFDVATHWGLEKHDEDFGQTLGYWGFSSGPYLMLPFLGPTTVRDGFGELGDYPLSYTHQIDDPATRNSVKFVDLVQTRAQLLELEKQLEDALDEYAFVRDAYLQNREYRVHDGKLQPTDDPYGADCEADCDDALLEDDVLEEDE
jgi:phospholipid-binding lipoprotein MlaA